MDMACTHQYLMLLRPLFINILSINPIYLALMNPLTDSGAIFAYHRQMIKTYGRLSSYALGWRNTESQVSRFKVLANIANLNGHSVFDAGCGYGDLLPYLQRLYPNLQHYCGMEQIPELLDEAIQRYGQWPGVSFISGNFISRQIPELDYVLASGSLNYSSTNPDFIFNAITKLYQSSRIGFGFNLLGKVPPNGLLIAYNQDKIMAHCQTLSSNVMLINDYTEEDFTVLMYH